ncbi:MAG TPA: DJ-1/PfpI family protein [Candidatus Pacearchaeota archaeon]|nr:DJ-1/PfpI family protein [Candidatus Pacearchaeota archaeon]
MKKAIIIVASKDFRDEEYFVTKEVLENNGISVKTACDKNRAIGKFGGEAIADILINDLNVDDFDAIIFAGGQGAVKLLDNELTYTIIRRAVAIKKILAAICITPTILAKAGVLKGKKATVWSTDMDKTGIKIVQLNDGIYQRSSIVKDGNIITAENAEFAQEFGEAIAEELTKI